MNRRHFLAQPAAATVPFVRAAQTGTRPNLNINFFQAFPTSAGNRQRISVKVIADQGLHAPRVRVYSGRTVLAAQCPELETKKIAAIAEAAFEFRADGSVGFI